MSAKEAGRVFGACVVDPTSVVGLRKLARERPGDWYLLLQAWVPKKVRLHDGLTLGEVLKAGVVGELFPKGKTGAETIRQARASARRLDARLGRARIIDISERVVMWLMERIRAETRAKTGRPGGRAMVSRDISMLRRVVRDYQGRITGRTRVRARTPGNKRRGAVKPRPVPKAWEVKRILAQVSEPSAKARVALAVGGGMLEGRSLRLRVRDVDIRRMQVWMSIPRNGEIHEDVGHWVQLPAWAVSALVGHMRTLRHLGPTALVFPSATNPNRPAESCRKELKAACQRARIPRDYDFHAIRRCWQALATEKGVAKGLVKQTLDLGPRTNPIPYRVPMLYMATRRVWGGVSIG